MRACVHILRTGRRAPRSKVRRNARAQNVQKNSTERSEERKGDLSGECSRSKKRQQRELLGRKGSQCLARAPSQRSLRSLQSGESLSTRPSRARSGIHVALPADSARLQLDLLVCVCPRSSHLERPQFWIHDQDLLWLFLISSHLLISAYLSSLCTSS